MRKLILLPRFFALFLALNLTLPSPAFALRNEQPVNAGMEEKITQALGHPAAGAEEDVFGVFDASDLSQRIADAVRSKLDDFILETNEVISEPVEVRLFNDSPAVSLHRVMDLRPERDEPYRWEQKIQKELEQIRVGLTSGNWVLRMKSVSAREFFEKPVLFFHVQPAPRSTVGAEEGPEQRPVSLFRKLVDAMVRKALETQSGRIGREYIHLSENTGIGKRLAEEARKAGYRGTVAIVPTAYLPEDPPVITGFRVYVQTVGKEVVESNLRQFVEIVQNPDEADLIVAGLSFEAGKRQELLRQGKIFLEVTAETAPAVTPVFLIHLQARGLLEKGASLFVGKLLKGDLGEGLLIFA